MNGSDQNHFILPSFQLFILPLHQFLIDPDIWRECHRDRLMPLDYEEIRVYSMPSDVAAEIENN